MILYGLLIGLVFFIIGKRLMKDGLCMILASIGSLILKNKNNRY